jgi:predicted nucleic acid-binding protein
MKVVCDTGPLLAVLNSRDKNHASASAFFDGFDGDLIVPALIVTEICYLAQTRIGPEAKAAFLDGIAAGELIIENATDEDWVRIAWSVRRYANFPLGVADASVVATAERLNITKVATIDYRHFRAVRPAHCEAFDLLPA